MEKRNLSRRGFLTGAAATGALAAVAGLSGCNSAGSGNGTTVPADDTASGSEGLSLEQGMGKWSFEVAPDPIPDNEIAETIENDIVVVGAGMSGMATACSAAEQGANVTLFSASSQPISRGGSNFSAYNKVIEEYGIERFDPQPYYSRELRAASYAVDQQKWFRGHNNSEEAMNWIIDMVREDGVQVFLERDNNEGVGPNYAVGFSGPEDADSASLGQQFAVEAVEKKALEHGVEIIYDTIARQLIREDDGTGRVTGVVAEKADGTYVKFVGHKAVVLATGDFSADKEMVAKYCPAVIPLVGTEQTEIDYNTGFSLTGIFGGDGQKMGLWIGAAWQRNYPTAPMMQGSWGGSTEPLAFHMGLNVNTNTERYQREDCSAPYSANHLLSQPGFTAYGIWTANYAQTMIDRGHDWYYFGNKYDVPAATAEEAIAKWEEGVEGGSYFKADTLDDLAKQLDLDAGRLKEEVSRYNELCVKGIDEDFHKDPDFLVNIEESGPFYAAKNSPLFMTVMGGLRTNYKLQVCEEDDTPIEGLFNVGCMIGDMYANTYNFAVPGHSYGINCITFGYLLGRDLANGEFD